MRGYVRCFWRCGGAADERSVQLVRCFSGLGCSAAKALLFSDVRRFNGADGRRHTIVVDNRVASVQCNSCSLVSFLIREVASPVTVWSTAC